MVGCIHSAPCSWRSLTRCTRRYRAYYRFLPAIYNYTNVLGRCWITMISDVMTMAGNHRPPLSCLSFLLPIRHYMPFPGCHTYWTVSVAELDLKPCQEIGRRMMTTDRESWLVVWRRVSSRDPKLAWPKTELGGCETKIRHDQTS